MSITQLNKKKVFYKKKSYFILCADTIRLKKNELKIKKIAQSNDFITWKKILKDYIQSHISKIINL